MGVRVLYDPAERVAVLYDSTSGWAFGPVIGDGEDGTAAGERAEAFLTWLDRDARVLSQSELEELWAAFCTIEAEEQ